MRVFGRRSSPQCGNGLDLLNGCPAPLQAAVASAVADSPSTMLQCGR